MRTNGSPPADSRMTLLPGSGMKAGSQSGGGSEVDKVEEIEG